MARILGVSTVDQCPGCCGTPGMSWECESITGTGVLYGISGYSADDLPYDPMDPEAWEGQYRKWAERGLSGSLLNNSHQCSDCPGYPASGGSDPATAQHEFSGTYEVGSAGVVTYGQLIGTPVDGFTCDLGTPGAPVNATGVGVGPGFSETTDCGVDLSPLGAGGAVLIEKTLITRVATGCGCGPSPDSYGNVSGVASEDLTEERYLYDAIFEQDPEAILGESCCTELTEANLTTPESIDPISLTGTAVRVVITISNTNPDTDYSVTVTTSQENPQPEDPEDPPVPPTITTYDIIIPGDAPVYYFHVPLPSPDDFPICVTEVVFNGAIEP